MATHGFLNVLSAILGYIYCIVWSCTSIPQFITNFRRKSVAGYSIEFLVLNMIGFVFYCVFVWGGSYFQRHYGLTESITIQDKFFATCGSIVTFSIGAQAFIFYPKTRTGEFRFINIVFGILLVAFGAYNILLGIGGFLPWFSKHETPYTFSVIHYFGFGKSFCSLVKYIPQVLLNIQRQSTVGYNIFNAMLDLTGGTASLLQMFVKCFAKPHEDGSPDWHHLFGNAPKLFLALESVTFDLIFLFHHFVLYRKNNLRIQKEEEQKLLLGDNLSDLSQQPQSSDDIDSAYSAIQ